jgi:hypothetical protein
MCICAYIDQEKSGAWFVQCAILQQGEFLGFFLEPLEIRSITELICQCIGKTNKQLTRLNLETLG